VVAVLALGDLALVAAVVAATMNAGSHYLRWVLLKQSQLALVAQVLQPTQMAILAATRLLAL
jgi:hypothetical protein